MIVPPVPHLGHAADTATDTITVTLMYVTFKDGRQIRPGLRGGSDFLVQAAVRRGTAGRNAGDGAPTA